MNYGEIKALNIIRVLRFINNGQSAANLYNVKKVQRLSVYPSTT